MADTIKGLSVPLDLKPTAWSADGPSGVKYVITTFGSSSLYVQTIGRSSRCGMAELSQQFETLGGALAFCEFHEGMTGQWDRLASHKDA